MLILLKVPADSVLTGIIACLEESVCTKLKKSPSKEKQTDLKFSIAEYEASICIFLYAYLVFTYDFYKSNDKSEENIKPLRTLWLDLVNLFK